MGFGFSDLTPEGRRYFEALKKLSELEVQVGFQGDQTAEDGTSLAEIAAYNELGTSTIPARPFMKQSFENHEDELRAACERVNAALASGKSVEQALTENAPSTIRKKGSDKPLIDTGTMRQSVNYVVKRRGG